MHFPVVRFAVGQSVVRLLTDYVRLSVRAFASPSLNLYVSGMCLHISVILIKISLLITRSI